MKKRKFSFLVLLILIILCGCGRTSEKEYAQVMQAAKEYLDFGGYSYTGLIDALARAMLPRKR